MKLLICLYLTRPRKRFSACSCSTKKQLKLQNKPSGHFLHLQCTFYQKKESILSIKASNIFFFNNRVLRLPAIVFVEHWLQIYKLLPQMHRHLWLPVMWKLWQRSARQQFVFLGRWVWWSRRWWTGNLINRLRIWRFQQYWTIWFIILNIMQSETQSTLNGYHNFNHEIKWQIKKIINHRWGFSNCS